MSEIKYGVGNISILDRPDIKPRVETWLLEEKTHGAICDLIGQHFKINITEDSIRRARTRWGIQTTAAKDEALDGFIEEIEVDDDPGTDLQTSFAEALVAKGYSPDEFDIASVGFSEKDEDGNRRSIRIVPKKAVRLLPARTDQWIAPQPVEKESSDGRKLFVIMGDHQVPFHDEHLHYLTCGWLEANQPDVIVNLGDQLDLPDASKHTLDPENNAEANECINGAYAVLRDLRVASPNSLYYLMPGNHDERLRNVFLSPGGAHPLAGLKTADTEDGPGEAVHGLPHLLHLNDLQINWVDPHGSYKHAQMKISPYLAVRHGWLARPKVAASALATLEKLHFSVIVGHTHRQSISYHTIWDIDGKPTTLAAAEAGCMCRVDKEIINGRRFPNYTTEPNWAQGFLTAEVYADGTFHLETVSYIKPEGKGKLMWRDQVFA